MKVTVTQIPQKGLVLQESIPASSLDLAMEGVGFVSPLEVQVFVNKERGLIDVKGSIKADFSFICSRCLTEFVHPLTLKVAWRLPWQAETNTVVLDDEIRQELVMYMPVKPLCSPDCKGLCICCGENLNKGECECGRGEARKV